MDAATRGRIVDAAAGNPLFLEQLLSMLIDDGRLRQAGDGWRLHGDLRSLQVSRSESAKDDQIQNEPNLF